MRWFITLLLCLLVSACFTSGKRGGDVAMATYDFGPAVPRLLAEPRKQALAVEVRAPLWFDSLGIDYRLLYVDAARLREYARARWAGPPAQLIQQRLMQQLDLVRAGQGQARCLLSGFENGGEKTDEIERGEAAVVGGGLDSGGGHGAHDDELGRRVNCFTPS